MKKYRILKNKYTGKYYCTSLFRASLIAPEYEETDYYEVTNIEAARKYHPTEDITEDVAHDEKYIIIDYNTELRRLKIEKINEKR